MAATVHLILRQSADVTKISRMSDSMVTIFGLHLHSDIRIHDIGVTWPAFDVLTEGLELRLPDSRVFVEDHRAAQSLCGPAQPLCSQLLGVCLKGRKRKGTRI